MIDCEVGMCIRRSSSHCRLTIMYVCLPATTTNNPFNSNVQIAESFRRFGISDETKHVIAVKVGDGDDFKPEDVMKHLSQHVNGVTKELNDINLADIHDISRIRKIYKAGPGPTQTGKNAASTGVNSGLEPFILGTMALKGS